MFTSKLARAGMKGRRRDTNVLRAVLTLSFVFIIVATVLIGSVDKTEIENRITLFGRFSLAYYQAGEQARNEILSDCEGVSVGSFEVIGETQNCGIISGYDETALELSCFNLLEGHYPQSDNEVVVENNTLGGAGDDLKVGDTFLLRLTAAHADVDMNVIQDYKNRKYEEIFENLENEFEPYFLNDFTNNHPFMEDYFGLDFLEADEQGGFNLGLHADGKQMDIEQLSDTEYSQLLNLYIRRFGNVWERYKEVRVTTNKLVPWEGLNITVRTTYLLVYDNKAQLKEKDMNDEAIAHGVIESQYVDIQKDCVLSGIIETYSDRWDCLNYPLPNSFTTQSCVDDIKNAIASASESFQNPPNYAPAYNLLLYSDIYDTNALYEKYLHVFESHIPEPDKVPMLDLALLELGDEGLIGLEEAAIYFTKLYGYEYDVYDVYDIASDAIVLASGEPISEENYPYKINTYSYPDLPDTKVTLNIVVIAIIFVTTACAVFQIFITQIKRRARKIALLKSVGATNGQIGSTILFEGLYMLLFALPVGAIFGVLLSYGLVYLINALKGAGSIVFYFDVEQVLIGLAAGCASLLIGILLPLIKAVRIPLTGSMSVDKKVGRKKSIKLASKGKTKLQTFSSVEKRHRAANRGRSLMFLFISCFIITIVLLSTFLSYMAFSDYNTTVIKNNKPSYALNSFYGMSQRLVEETTQKIEQSPAGEQIERIDAVTLGEMVYMRYDGMLDEANGSPILRSLYDAVPDSLFGNYFTEFRHGVVGDLAYVLSASKPVSNVRSELDRENVSFNTSLYAVDSSSQLFADISAAITQGAINVDAYNSGDQVIVLVPTYIEGQYIDSLEKNTSSDYENTPRDEFACDFLNDIGAMELSYYKDNASIAKTDTSLKVGSAVELYAETQDSTESGRYLITHGLSSSAAAIINYFPGDNMWPFSGTSSPYTVICSPSALFKVYPNAGIRIENDDLSAMRTMIRTYYQYCYGKTIFNIYAKDTATRENSDLPLLTLSKREYCTLENYRDSNYALYSKAINNVLIIGLLGMASSMIAFVILYNTTASSVDQERKRFGILQSMGVTRKRFISSAAKEGFVQSIISVLIANLIIALVLFFTTFFSTMELGMSFMDTLSKMATSGLYLYPFVLHAAFCALFILITVYINVLPVKKVTKYSPVENIRA